MILPLAGTLGPLGRGRTLRSAFPAGDFGTLRMWFDAEREQLDAPAGNSVAVGSPVAFSPDYSGYDCHGISTGTVTLRSGGPGARRYLEAPTNSDFLSLDRLDLTQNVGALSAYVVARANTWPANAGLIFWSTGANAGSWRLAIGRLSGNPGAFGRRLDSDGLGSLPGGQAASTGWHLYRAVFDYTNAQATFARDDLTPTGPSSWLTAGSTSNTSSLQARLAVGLNADVALALVYQGAHDSSQQAAARDAINQHFLLW